MNDPLADLKRWSDELRDLPPMPRVVYTHHTVPYGRCYKQWMTNGELVLWVNRGEVEDMPRQRGPVVRPLPSATWGIPVINR